MPKLQKKYQTSTWKGFALEALLPMTPHLLSLIIKSDESRRDAIFNKTDIHALGHMATLFSGVTTAGINLIGSHFYLEGWHMKTFNTSFITDGFWGDKKVTKITARTDAFSLYGFTTCFSGIAGIFWSLFAVLD